jgi:hypothetical protein
VCAFDGAEAACAGGECTIGACRPDRYNRDGRVDNGCEVFCEQTNGGVEACDELDNDCDGRLDEDFDLQNDAERCGACGNVCGFENATAECIQGGCVLAECERFYYDVNLDPDDGCEYLCLPTNGGVEACDNIDNDCDGVVDNGFDLDFDAQNCGRCGNVCPEPDNGRAACFDGECGVSLCEDGYEDCNRDADDGCEANLDEPETCLTCGNLCEYENAVPGCGAQGCFLAECLPGWTNPNGRSDDGCEYACTLSNAGVELCDGVDNDCDTFVDEDFDTRTDALNCGECGTTCATPDGSLAVCQDSACVVSECLGTTLDCDLDHRNGCEADRFNPNTCLTCDTRCAFPRAVAGCDAQGCFLQQCDTFYYNINGDPADGCEYACIPSNNGVERCDEVDNDCDGLIDEDFDLQNDELHCGECGNDCGEPADAQAACVRGQCVIEGCEPDTLDCNAGEQGGYDDGCEADRLSPLTCLSCDNTCAYPNAVPGCNEQGCFLAECLFGYVDVNRSAADGCEYQCVPNNGGVEACDNIDNDCDRQIDEDFDTQTNADHCGRCGNACGAPPNAQAICVGGECEIDGCEPGFLECNNQFNDGCEAPRTSPRTCLSCNNACAYNNGVPGCNEQGCFLDSCTPGFVNANTNPADGCELRCTPSNNGVEICDYTDNDCDGMADDGFDLQNSLSHCGECNRSCTVAFGTPVCTGGACQILRCDNGRADCDGQATTGCEVNTTNTLDHCGACNFKCDRDWSGRANATTTCSNSACAIAQCFPTYDNCDGQAATGCETHLTDDVRHCGQCGRACTYANAAPQCVNGGCQMGSCNPGYYNLDGSTANGCEYRCDYFLANGRAESTDDPDDNFSDANCDGIDGDLARAIFVRSDGTGNDANNGLTPGTAVRSFARAIQRANENPNRSQILIATGSYPTSSPVDLRGGLRFYGGYSQDFRGRTDGRASLEATSDTAMNAFNLNAATLLDRVNLSVSNRADTSDSAIVLKVDNSASNLTLRYVTINAGRGGSGTAGGAGSPGSNGTGGRNANEQNGGGGGVAGGGAGATGRNQATGPEGASGSANGSGCGGGGGAGSGSGGLGCGDGDPRNGGNGGSGCPGVGGVGGARGNNLGTLSGVDWFPVHATGGGSGGAGGGGGGGGAGGGEDCESCPCFGGCCFCLYCGTGRGGGGGGGGGDGGSGGAAGLSGGASIGILLRNSTITTENVTVTTAGGGNGGAGGAGGGGGSGGGGGFGATDTNNSTGEGGNGGRGGDGGRGGCGGGGSGGPSIAVWGNGGAALTRRGTNNFTAGAGGNGGSSCGNAGQAGPQENTRGVSLQ